MRKSKFSQIILTSSKIVQVASLSTLLGYASLQSFQLSGLLSAWQGVPTTPSLISFISYVKGNKMYYAVRSATINLNGRFTPPVINVNLNNFIEYNACCLDIRWAPVFCNVSQLIPIPLAFINSTTYASISDAATIFIESSNYLCIWGSVALENEYGEAKYSVEGPVTEVTSNALKSCLTQMGKLTRILDLSTLWEK
ncbi:hypothetical protein [Stygiolobus caldivivus]|uniref:Uncharacterized protein n=1 Tax=Stygiolobus caldivivus TaxID=2824673 RepID=A0A8D5ZER1_9CREN|nr:hypothetical protein [Stygiolobus caldivivus]BCU69823.1 hypothetical protein KN1_11200 [Stygiolobus caldivivus]